MQDPIFSPGILKAAGILLAATVIGFGAYALAGGIDIDLPDLPEAGTEATQIDEETFEEATLGEPEETEGVDQFTGAGLDAALAALREEVGDFRFLELLINEVQTRFVVIRGGDTGAYSFLATDRRLEPTQTTLTLCGSEPGDAAFPAAAARPEAVDRIAAAIRRRTSGELRFDTMTLSRGPIDCSTLGWTINVTAGGTSHVFEARPDGRGLRDRSAGGVQLPQAAIDARRLGECIRGADGDPDRISACFDEHRAARESDASD